MADATVYNDADIYLNVAGFVGVLPYVTPKGLDKATTVAVNEGRKQIALRRAQALHKKLTGEKKSNDEIRAGINTMLAGFSVDENQGFQSVGERRKEIATDYLRDLLKNAGKAHDDATLERNLPALMKADSKHAPALATRFNDWLNSYTAPSKRASGGTEATGEAMDLEAL